MYGLIGRKLAHSYSPAIHRLLTDGAYDYELIELEPDEVGDFIRSGRYDGLNVTIPYKRTVIPFLDDLTPSAARIGAVNTIFRRGGRLIGDNTDAFGVRFALERIGFSPRGRNVLILGGGGTARTVETVLRDLAAASIRFVSRSGPITYDRAPSFKDTDLIVNTTPVGMFPETDGTPIDLDGFPRLTGVFDAIYNPLATRLIQQAQRLGVPNGCGLTMLIAQAHAAAELFMDKSLDPERIEKVYRSLRTETENIVLVGMPGCGKSRIGAALAARVGKRFVDLDSVLSERVGMPIPAFFETRGEAAFREIEAAIAAEYGKKTGQVLATGGGVVLRPENRINLRLNGFVIFLERDLKLLAKEGRPLSLAARSLDSLAERRLPLYRECADIRVENRGKPDDVVREIIRRYRLRRAAGENIGD